MKDYKINGKIVEVELESGKIVKISYEWVQRSMKALDTDMEDIILMYLEDNNYIKNEEQEELDKEAKGKVKLIATDTAKKKTPRERVQKENPDKEYLISTIAEYLKELNANNITIENKAKLITFTFKGKEFKFDLVEKRKPKATEK